ncbi:acetyltransferase [Pseudomonas simiae]|nr:acetyltransferase [Pseudomonas simiae]
MGMMLRLPAGVSCLATGIVFVELFGIKPGMDTTNQGNLDSRTVPLSQRNANVSIRKLEQLPVQIRALEVQAVAEGFRFLTRLITEWEDGTHRFDQPGECFLGMFCEGQLIAVGGLSCDPFAGPGVGRLRRVYVERNHRGRQAGKALVHQLLENAAVHFYQVRLSTDSSEAAAFYLRCGFDQVADDTATHTKTLGHS